MERNRNSLNVIITRVVIILVCIGIIFSTLIVTSQANLQPYVETPETTVETINIDAVISEHFENFTYEAYSTSDEVAIAMAAIDEYCIRLRALAKEIPEATPAINEELFDMEELYLTYEYDYFILYEEEEKWNNRYEEYPEATYIWLYMRNEFQWSPEVCAGIIGNMMSECGGQTLKGLSNWDTDESSGYGLIQWIGGRRRSIEARYGSHPSIEEQLLFMRDEMYGTNGVTNQLYVDGWLEAIMSSETPEQAAARFAKYFERPASSYYGTRQNNARTAYEYFVD